MNTEKIAIKNRLTLRTKITVIIATILLIFIGLIIFITKTFVLEKINNNLVSTIYVTQEEIDRGTTYLLDSITPVHNAIQDGLNSADYQNEIKIIYQDILKHTAYDEDFFYDIILINNQQLYSKLDLNYKVLIDDNYIETIKSTNKLLEPGKIISLNDQLLLMVGKSLFDNSHQNETIIYLLNVNKFKQILTNNSKNNSLSMIIDENQIIACNDEKYIGKTIFDEELFNIKNNNYKIVTINKQKSIIIKRNGEKTSSQYDLNWQYISILDYQELTKDINQLNSTIIIISILSFITSIILAYFLSAGLIKPIQNLKEKMRHYQKNEENAIINTSKDDIKELETSFNDMIERITNLIKENEIQSENKRKLELYALQMQINPHFLYNTLDAIAWLAKLKKQPEIEQLVMALAQFFRISLHKGDKFITVEEEVELIKNYIAIEQIRFPDKFKIEYYIDDDVKNYETMKLILQPLVENAIKHGISELEKEGSIIIKAYQDEKYIYFEVIDNGIGFDPTKQTNPTKKMSGYGFKNVDERIKLEYGSSSGVTIASKINEGTTVTIKILKR